ncbi:hypothetical protein D3C72_2363380 [compost metagenome]
MNFCPPKPGLTLISRIMSTLSITYLSASSGVAGLNTRPDLAPPSRISCRERSMCSEASGWKVM